MMRTTLTLLAGVLVAAGLSLPVPASAMEAEASGWTQARDGKLRRGCHDYSFTYSVTTPYGDWMLETSVHDRTGRAVASHALVGPEFADSGRLTYTLCRWATRPGRFLVKARLTWYDDPDEGTTTRLPDSTFRLRRPG